MRGIDYYPEQWDRVLMDDDLDRIVALGADTIRIGEFSWHILEPREGEFDFRFWDEVIAKAKVRGLKIIFGTPTATFPRWLSLKHPEIHGVNPDLTRREFGGRRLYCYHSEIYLSYVKKLVQALVCHYQNEEAIVGWQIDNELGHEGSDLCFCPSCQAKFTVFLSEKYKDIAALNQAYGSDFWSQKYNAFEEVPIPLNTITFHNPALALDWYSFRSDAMIRFAQAQVNIVRKYKGKHQSITHNLFGGYFHVALDQYRFAKDFDYISFDNYPVWGGMDQPLSYSEIAFSLNYMRNLKQKNFCVMEQLVGAQGHEIIGYSPSPKQALLWAKQAILHGADSLFFFRYRGYPKAQEQLCQGIYNMDNQENKKSAMVKEFFAWQQEFISAKQKPALNQVALLYDFDNCQSWKHQKQYKHFDYTRILNQYYAQFQQFAVGVDILSANVDFSAYKILLLPIFQLVDEELIIKIKNFVDQGGIIVASYRLAVRDRQNNFYFAETTPVGLKDVFGLTTGEFITLGEGRRIALYKEGKEISYGQECLEEIFFSTAKAIFCDEQAHPISTINAYGKGFAYYIATELAEQGFKFLIEHVLQTAQIETRAKADDLEVIDYQQGSYLLNHSAQEIQFKGLKIPAYDILYIEK